MRQNNLAFTARLGYGVLLPPPFLSAKNKQASLQQSRAQRSNVPLQKVPRRRNRRRTKGRWPLPGKRRAPQQSWWRKPSPRVIHSSHQRATKKVGAYGNTNTTTAARHTRGGKLPSTRLLRRGRSSEDSLRKGSVLSDVLDGVPVLLKPALLASLHVLLQAPSRQHRGPEKEREREREQHTHQTRIAKSGGSGDRSSGSHHGLKKGNTRAVNKQPVAVQSFGLKDNTACGHRSQYRYPSLLEVNKAFCLKQASIRQFAASFTSSIHTSRGYLVKPHLLDWRIFWRPGNLNLARRRASTAVGRWLSLDRIEMMI